MDERVLEARSGSVTLAGSVWLPSDDARVGVVMHPGSGPSDRRNDGYFDAIREHLVGHGVAVAGFDKRGVGGSSGRWQDAGIIEQAADALSALDAVRDLPELRDVPIGLFGHSQGGWVVIEAAAGGTVPFVVCNSGPGVTPAAQERFSLTTALPEGDLPDPHLQMFDRGLALARAGAPYSEVLALAGALDPYVPAVDELSWQFWVHMLDYDPEPALRLLRVPLLALFGGDDDVVPVSESVTVFERALAPERSSIAVIPGGNHRIQLGTPPRLADGYLETLTAFLDEQA